MFGNKIIIIKTIVLIKDNFHILILKINKH